MNKSMRGSLRKICHEDLTKKIVGSVDGDDADLLYTTFLRAIEAKVAEKCGMRSGMKNALKSDFNI